MQFERHLPSYKALVCMETADVSSSAVKVVTREPEKVDVAFKKRGKRGGTVRKRRRTSGEEGERKVLPKKENTAAGGQDKKKRKLIDDVDVQQSVDKESREQDKRELEIEQDAKDARIKKQKKSFGPQVAPKHIKTSVTVDYQPDVCKDYKETGFCGFGDACKFLHDRTNYKSGWQVEKDWQTRQKERREAIMRGEDPDVEKEETKVDKDDDGLPFACHICREEFKKPVVTLCEHYFCEQCALKRMEKDTTCAICKTPLRGILNVGRKIIAKRKKTDLDSK